MPRRSLRLSATLAFWLVVALQVSTVIAFAAVREISLRTGHEIVLATVPVDPRDLFRGDYVILRYRISTIEPCFYKSGETIFVPLRGSGDSWGQSGPTSRSYDGAAQNGDVVIRGQVSRVSGRRCDVTYGIESFFVPEGTGRDIVGTPRVKVSVDPLGAATIRRLVP